MPKPALSKETLADRLLDGLNTIYEEHTDSDTELNKLKTKLENCVLSGDKVPDHIVQKTLAKLEKYEGTKEQAGKLSKKVHKGKFETDIQNSGVLGKAYRGLKSVLSSPVVKYPLLFTAGGLAGPTVGNAIVEVAKFAGTNLAGIDIANPFAVIPENANVPLRSVATHGAAGYVGFGVGALATGAAMYVGMKDNGSTREKNLKKHEKSRMKEDGLSRKVYLDDEGNAFRRDRKGDKQYVKPVPTVGDASTNAESKAPNGTMVLIDDQGNRTVVNVDAMKSVRKAKKAKNRTSGENNNVGA